jgi:hypothetical protein
MMVPTTVSISLTSASMRIDCPATAEAALDTATVVAPAMAAVIRYGEASPTLAPVCGAVTAWST